MAEKPTYEELEKRIQDLEQAEFERIQPEKARLEDKEQYKSLLHNIQAAVVVHGSDTKIIATNPKAEELLGLTETQMLGRVAIDPGWKFFDSDKNKMPFKQYPVKQVLNTQQVLRNLTLSIYRPDTADSVWVLVNADPVFNEKRDIKQVIVTFMDITDHKKTEDALRKNEKKYRRINTQLQNSIDSMPTAYILWNTDSQVVEWNKV